MLQCPTCGRRFASGVSECPEDGTPLRADATVGGERPRDPLAGLVLDDKYRLDERLGEGGMGAVYRATHLLIERPVAVKVLSARLVTDEAAKERFRREARAAGRLQHTNAVAVTDFGETKDGLVYIVMELLEGTPLRSVLAREAPLDPARAVSLMLQIAAAVSAAHEAGIIHRDLKPGNIFIVQRPHAPHIVKVLDFGIAKLAEEVTGGGDPVNTLTGTGVMIGTPRYMSPEQCDGATLTPASDVYSLGVILYEMLTGQTPFTGATPLALALKHSSEQPRRPSELVTTMPPPLEALVLRALEKSADARPSDAGEFRRELYAVAESLGYEHAAGFSAPTLETLRDAGTQTPSGRLVIDLERLRQSRATAPMTAEGVPAQPTEEEEAVPTGGARERSTPHAGSAKQAGSTSHAGSTPHKGATADAAPFSEQSIAEAAPVTPSADAARARDGDSAIPSSSSAEARRNVRVQIPLRRDGQSLFEWVKQPAVILGIAIVALAFILGAVIARRMLAGRAGETRTADAAEESVGRTLTPADVAPRAARAADREPRSAAEFYERGAYYFSSRNYEGAARDYRRALELQPDFPEAHNRLGRVLMMQSRFSDAASEFRRAVEQKGGSYAAAQYNLGFALQTMRDLDDAVRAYEGA
ncbi:MAG TPA: serine/threonine-protein kinase, partial [Pyrinomonadaceae bacterium]|nr:serine/threonine-protein kinase [Pyrinomonadaceae bacterium]